MIRLNFSEMSCQEVKPGFSGFSGMYAKTGSPYHLCQDLLFHVCQDLKPTLCIQRQGYSVAVVKPGFSGFSAMYAKTGSPYISMPRPVVPCMPRLAKSSIMTCSYVTLAAHVTLRPGGHDMPRACSSLRHPVVVRPDRPQIQLRGTEMMVSIFLFLFCRCPVGVGIKPSFWPMAGEGQQWTGRRKPGFFPHVGAFAAAPLARIVQV